jgi:heme-degrading monooxygenase HmoA
MYVVLWEFYCKRDQKDKLIQANMPNGKWHRFFSSSPDYLGTEVLRDVNNKERLVILDRWSSKISYDNFLDRHCKEYEEIDHNLRNLTDAENSIGSFEC